MPRETLRALDHDLERLLLAGGGVARTDDGLHARQEALARFASKVPALGKVAEQVAKVTTAKPREAGGELLALLAMAYQVRGAQAQAGAPAGELAGAPGAVPMETPLTSFEIDPLYRALARKSGERAQVVEHAIERDQLRDLRLLPLWIDALEDTTLADLVAHRVIPALGDAALSPLLAAFKIDGGVTDARRLGCVVALQGRAAEPLLARCVREGSPAIRVAALGALVSLDRVAAEPVALELLVNDRSADVRAAAAAALGESALPDALEPLLAALTDTAAVRRGAAAALRTLPHPETTARLLARLTDAALKHPEPKHPEAKKNGSYDEKAMKAYQAERAKWQERVAQVRAVLEVLGARRDPAARARLLGVWNAGKLDVSLRAAAGRGLLDGATPEVLAALAKDYHRTDYEQRAVSRVALLAAHRLVDGEGDAPSYDTLQRFFEPALLKKSEPARALAASALHRVALSAGPGTDRRWVALAKDLLRAKGVDASAVRALVALEARDAAPLLRERLDEEDASAPALVLDALVRWGDRATVPVLLEKLERGAKRLPHYWLYDALRRLGASDALPALEARLAKAEPETPPAAKAEPEDGKKKGAAKSSAKAAAKGADAKKKKAPKVTRFEAALLRETIEALRGRAA